MAVTSAPPVRQLRFPRLRAGLPVLQRNDGEIQVGLDGDSLIFAESRLRAVLECLDGAHHLRQLRELGRQVGLAEGEVDRTLRVLDDARLLGEGGRRLSPTDPLEERSVRLIGAGALGEAIARLLAGSNLGRLWLVDEQPAEPGPGNAAVQTLLTRSEALRAALAGRPRLRIDVASHWSKPEGARADLTVIASETVEPDRLLTDDLVRTDQPHLIVRSTGNAVVVGPLVVPGRTACLHCTDLTRRDADSSWPALLDQLTRLRLPADPTLSAWAASVAATQAVGYLRGGTPEACGATIELGDNDLLTRWRSWHSHPSCGCHWPAATQWGA
jgi:bacteriocin biosynthesis cyclodehydratase domain-containing protein